MRPYFFHTNQMLGGFIFLKKIYCSRSLVGHGGVQKLILDRIIQFYLSSGFQREHRDIVRDDVDTSIPAEDIRRDHSALSEANSAIYTGRQTASAARVAKIYT